MTNFVFFSLRLVAGVCLLSVALIVAVDTLFRYLFSAPIYGAQDVQRVLLLTMFMAALADAWLAGANFRMDLVFGTLLDRIRVVIEWFSLLLALALAVALFSGAAIAIRYNLAAGARTPLLEIPYWGVAIVVFIGSAVFLLAILTDCGRRLREPAEGRDA